MAEANIDAIGSVLIRRARHQAIGRLDQPANQVRQPAGSLGRGVGSPPTTNLQRQMAPKFAPTLRVEAIRTRGL